MTKLRRSMTICLLVVAVLVLAASSRGQTRPPIVEQLAKTYGLDSCGGGFHGGSAGGFHGGASYGGASTVVVAALVEAATEVAAEATVAESTRSI